MANRTIQIQGLAYGAVSASIGATFNANTVFSGTVNTLNEPVPALPDPTLEGQLYTLFSFDVDTAVTGNVTMSCNVTEGPVIFAQILSNYASVANPVYTPAQLSSILSPTTPQADKVAIWTELASPPLTPEEQAILLDPATISPTVNRILAEHNLSPYINDPTAVAPLTYPPSLDPRFSVEIDGIAQNPARDLPGCWYWTVNSGSTLSWQMNLQPIVL